ncbi:MAG: phosphodiester glycosidase family protein, partial [Patescibacteria group bacterium]
LLSERNYASASASLTNLQNEIKTEKDKIISSFKVPENLPEKNEAPDTGYSKQKVTVDGNTFVVAIIAADLANTKVIVDTASDSTCTNDCPVLSLADYVAKNNAFAGVNGSYFCPASYPSCVGKINSFDTLLMNRNKTYFNSDNNVYSTNPAVIFGGSYIRFVSSASEWGRDTGIDSMISNYPLLVFNSNVSFGGDDDPKKGSKGSRSFIANQGSKVFIGVVYNATVAESARVLKTMGMENALNLDNGGSTALWSGGYKVGPGRDLPNVILFVKK